jgi:hypothetical protein
MDVASKTVRYFSLPKFLRLMATDLMILKLKGVNAVFNSKAIILYF